MEYRKHLKLFNELNGKRNERQFYEALTRIDETHALIINIIKGINRNNTNVSWKSPRI
jgi:hypothetical protein